MSVTTSVGLIDWGIGGLSVYKALIREFNSISCVYFSDSSFTPYGKSPKKKLVQRLHSITDFFRTQNIFTIVVACNAASTVLADVKKLNPDMQYVGMLEAGELSIKKSKVKSVLVLGGERTIKSRFFQNSFQDSNIQLHALVAQPLSALIEKGLHKSKLFESTVDDIIKEIDFMPEAVLLACTHYPAAMSVFQKKFPQAVIIDPAEILAHHLRTLLPKQKTQSTSVFYTTGSTIQSKTAALKAFELQIPFFRRVRLG